MKYLLACIILPAACACGGMAGDVPTFTSCSANGIQVVTQDSLGVFCLSVAANVYSAKNAYEARWGALDLSGWIFRFTTLPDVLPGHNSTTTWASQLVQIGRGGTMWLPHELHHVQLGPSSAQHAGWCADFEPWEKATYGIDERSYLGCAQ